MKRASRFPPPTFVTYYNVKSSVKLQLQLFTFTVTAPSPP